MKQIQALQKSFLKIMFLVIGLTARIFAADGDVDPSFNAGVTGYGSAVYSAVRQPDGKLVVAGNFQIVNGRSYNNVARLNVDGSLDTTFNIGNGAFGGSLVYAVALQPDGKILIGGTFPDWDVPPSPQTRPPRQFLARLNTNGSLDTSFIGLGTGTGPDGTIQKIVVQPDGKILIGGSFSTYSHITVGSINVGSFARLNADGTPDTAFNNALGTGFTRTGTAFSVEEITLQPNGQMLDGGSFTAVNGITANGLARLNAGGTVDTTFAANIGTAVGAGFFVKSIAVQTDSKIVLVGGFDAFNGTPRNRIARLNANGTLDAGFDSVVTNNRILEQVAIQPDGRIIVLGAQVFLGTGANTRYSIARLNAADGSIDPTFNAGEGADGVTLPTLLLDVTTGSVYIGGGMANVNDVPRLAFARLDANGSLSAGFAPILGTQATVNALTVQSDDKILVGGDFFGMDGLMSPKIACLNTNGTVDTTFNPLTAGYIDGSVNAIAVQLDGKIIIGGSFTYFGGVNKPGIARLNANGTRDMTFIGETNAAVQSIAIQNDGKIIIGGLFNVVNATDSRNFIARLNTDGTTDMTFGIGTGFNCNCNVEAVKLQPNGQILVGGFFDRFNGTTGVNGLARLNSNGSLDNVFNTNTGTGFNSTVYDIDIQTDGKILTTGSFFLVNGTSKAGLARLNENGTIDGTFNVGIGFNNVSPLNLALQPNGQMVVGGSFAEYQGVFRPRIVRINSNGMLDPTFTAQVNSEVNINKIAIQSSGKIIIGGYFREYLGTKHYSIARLFNRDTVNFRSSFDFDNDNLADLSVYRNGIWFILQSTGGNTAVQWGIATDKIVPADYNGDGKTDYAVFRNGFWFILYNGGGFQGAQWGNPGDIPFPGDFDGDNKDDLCVFRNGTWFVLKSSGGTITQNWGNAGDIPVVADYDADGKADFAVYRNGIWFVLFSGGGNTAIQWGIAGDKTVQADYNGDGKADFAVFRNGFWFVLLNGGGFQGAQWGAVGDVPAPADYDGDGRTDLAVFRNGTWFIQRTTAGVQIVNFGLAGDTPIPSAYIP